MKKIILVTNFVPLNFMGQLYGQTNYGKFTERSSLTNALVGPDFSVSFRTYTHKLSNQVFTLVSTVVGLSQTFIHVCKIKK